MQKKAERRKKKRREEMKLDTILYSYLRYYDKN